MATVPGVDSSGYLIANNQEAAGLCLKWLRDGLAAAGELELEALIEPAGTAAAGSGGIIFTPWIAGERSPVDDRWARGGWHNVSASAGAAELIRSVLEGVAFNSRWLLAVVEHFAHRRIDALRIFGGGAQSDLWCQVYADVLERRIERVADPVFVNLRGAALLAAMGLGVERRDEIRRLVPVDRVFTHDPRNRAVYDRLYGEFARIYRRERRMFSRLNRSVPPTGTAVRAGSDPRRPQVDSPRQAQVGSQRQAQVSSFTRRR